MVACCVVVRVRSTTSSEIGTTRTHVKSIGSRVAIAQHFLSHPVHRFLSPFHVLLEVPPRPDESLSDGEIVRRMFDLSEFMKALKQQFTLWFNLTHDRVGTL